MTKINKLEEVGVGYFYEGPLSLGSIVAHSSGAAGLFVNRKCPTFLFLGKEEDDSYILSIYQNGRLLTTFKGSADHLGRRKIGRELLFYLQDILGRKRSSWGSLVGVRPLKLYHKLRFTVPQEKIRDHFLRERDMQPEKVDLLLQIGKIQEPYVDRASEDDKLISVYGGIPFCTTRCTYCSFPYGLIQDYPSVDAFLLKLKQDIIHAKRCIEKYGLQVESLYLGGGTPTSLHERDFKMILKEFSQLQKNKCEFTVEAGRPDTVNEEKLQAIVEMGANRISINPQTLQNHILRIIGRGHTAEEIEAMYYRVRRDTNLQINMDFIAGLPDQTLGDMKENMKAVCQWLPENVTIHTLALKKGSPLYAQRDRFTLPNEEEVEEMTILCKDMLMRAGYKPYYLYRQQYMSGQLENIGYTLEGKESVYNIQMMEERQSIISIGPGSSTKLMGAPSFKQSKMHIPKDIDVYNETLSNLLTKRELLLAKFYGE